MARKLRIRYPGALYHIINRGNYRRDVFATVGAAQAFERAIDETCRRFHWRMHAYVIMRNHFHFGLETPQPNLADGMHWLQSTFAIRFNRFRKERGHLFQGRYDAILLEDNTVLARVVHYIHLNPVRAHIVELPGCSTFRWSSLRHLRHRMRPPWLSADALLGTLAFSDCPAGWREYDQFLAALGSDPREQDRLEFGRLSRGWAIGTQAWKRQLAREHSHTPLPAGLDPDERHALQSETWNQYLGNSLAAHGRTREEAARSAPNVTWKVTVAAELRDQGVPYRWISRTLHMSPPRIVGSLVFRLCERRMA